MNLSILPLLSNLLSLGELLKLKHKTAMARYPNGGRAPTNTKGVVLRHALLATFVLLCEPDQPLTTHWMSGHLFIYLLLKHTLLELGAVAAAALTMSGQIFAKPVVPGTCF